MGITQLFEHKNIGKPQYITEKGMQLIKRKIARHISIETFLREIRHL